MPHRLLPFLAYCLFPPLVIADFSMFDIAPIIKEIAIFAVPMFLGITCHEVAHGYVAYLLGDPTAKNAGRLTLNPIKHLDPVGTLVFILTRRIGWAKPVPVDPRYFQNPRRDMVLVSVAGPVTNFILAALFYGLYLGLLAFGPSFSQSMQHSLLVPLVNIAGAGTLVNIVLGVFNLLPLPPLDGSKILAGFLPRHLAYQYLQIERYGFIILILLAMTGVFGKFLNAVVGPVYSMLF